MNRRDVENTLLKIGVPSGTKGFQYIADGILLLSEKKIMKITKDLYPQIADINESTSSRVERAIRHAFLVTREKGNPELVEHYIGMNNPSNFNSLSMLCMRIKYEYEQGVKKDEWLEEIHNFKLGWNGWRFLVVYGKGMDGWFVSIPNQGMCVEIAEPNNVEYNSRKLESKINIDGAGDVLAYAIKKNWEEL